MSMKLSYLLYIAMFFTVMACKKKTEAPAPEPVALLLPAASSLCTSGVIVSATESTITFSWTPTPDANSYELTVKNLVTGISQTKKTTTNLAALTLLRGTPYSWSITASTGSQSDTWRFYNAGEGSAANLPFPAEAVSPAWGQSLTSVGGSIDLNWTASDVDNDIANYDLYFGTTTTPPLFKSAVTDMFLKNVPVATATTYYWKVITKDKAGNTSDSGLLLFNVK
jgi:hypothetical protein